MKIKYYLFATLLPVAAAALQYYLWSFFAPFVWFLFFPTVFFVARLGGLTCAMISAVISSLLVWFVFLPLQFSDQAVPTENLLTVILFLFISYVLGYSQDRLIRAVSSLQQSIDKSELQNVEITRRYDQNLALNNVKFSDLADSLPQIVWATTPAGKTIFFNRHWYEYTGMSIEESMGDGWNKPFHPEDQLIAWKAWQNAVENNCDYSVECRLRRSDGVYRWWLIRGIPAFNQKHEIDKWFGTCTDINSIKQTLAELASEKSKLQTIFENSPDGIAIIRHDESFIDYNQKYLAYFHLDNEAQLSYSYSELMNLFDVSTIRGEVVVEQKFPGLRALAGEPVFSNELHLKNRLTGHDWYGSHSSMPIRDEHGNITGAVLSVRDITGNVQDQIKLLNTVREQDTVLNSGIAGIAKTKARKFLWMNSRFVDNFGYSAEELLGQSSEILYPDFLAFQSFGHTIEGMTLQEKTIIKEAIQLKRKDGSLGWFLVGGGPLFAGSDESIWMSIDVSQDRKNQELLEAYTKRLEKSMEDTLTVLSKALDMRDPYTAGHQMRVGILAEEIGKKLHLSVTQTHNLRLIGLVHDVGKIGVPAEILSKPTRLSQIEHDLVKTHVSIGYDILKDVDFLAPVAEVVREHHERMDGSGYPQGLKGDQILLEARIIAVADVVESMTTHRPYRPALGLDKALAELESGRSTKYDAAVVDACLELFRKDGYQLVSEHAEHPKHPEHLGYQ